MSDRHVVTIPIGEVRLDGELVAPDGASGIVVFAHGSGSSRLSPRNNYVADVLRAHGLGTLRFDLLTAAEDRTHETRFDVDLLTERLFGATRWLRGRGGTGDLRLGYFGSSTGAAAALRAAADRDDVSAVVSRGGRVDLAAAALPSVGASTLFVVGGADTEVLARNREALAELTCRKELAVIEGTGHLFEGEGELEAVADLAAEWFVEHLS